MIREILYFKCLSFIRTYVRINVCMYDVHCRYVCYYMRISMYVSYACTYVCVCECMYIMN